MNVAAIRAQAEQAHANYCAATNDTRRIDQIEWIILEIPAIHPPMATGPVQGTIGEMIDLIEEYADGSQFLLLPLFSVAA